MSTISIEFNTDQHLSMRGYFKTSQCNYNCIKVVKSIARTWELKKVPAAGTGCDSGDMWHLFFLLSFLVSLILASQLFSVTCQILMCYVIILVRSCKSKVWSLHYNKNEEACFLSFCLQHYLSWTVSLTFPCGNDVIVWLGIETHWLWEIMWKSSQICAGLHFTIYNE